MSQRFIVNRENFYIRGEFLGEGAFGKCYKVLHVQNDNNYVIKIIPKRADGSNDVLFQNETKLHKDLNHTNIVKMIDEFDDSRHYFIILEFCAVGTLTSLLKKRNNFIEDEVQHIIGSILNGLSYLHSALIMHRDLKPDNILIGENMQIKIADFGLSTQLANENETLIDLCGTPKYLSPKMIRRVGYGLKTDLWPVGVIMVELLTGKNPFADKGVSATFIRIIAGKYALPPFFTRKCKKAIKAMLTVEPEKRCNATQALNLEFFYSAEE